MAVLTALAVKTARPIREINPEARCPCFPEEGILLPLSCNSELSPHRESLRWPGPEKHNPTRPETSVSFIQTPRSTAERGESAGLEPGQDR